MPQQLHRPVAAVVDTAVVDTAVLAGDTAVVLAEAAFVAVGLGVVDSTVLRLAVSAAGLVDSVGPRLVAASMELGLAVSAVP